MQELTGERHAAATALFRALAAGEGQDAETSKRQQSQIKQNQPAFVPSVHLEGGRSSKHIKGYPGSIMVDIDGIPEEIFDETLERVRADPHSFLAYKTLSGRGIRVIAWMEGEVTEENFPAAWQTVNAYYARLTGIAIDRQCKNATRMSVICHDPDALYRPDAERMKFASLPDAKAGQKQDIAAGKKTKAVEEFLKQYEIVPRNKENQSINHQNQEEMAKENETQQQAAQGGGTQQQPQYRYNESMINWEQLKNFGISREYLQERGLLEQMLKGYKTNQVVPISMNFGSAVLRTDARLSFQQSMVGEVVLGIHGIRQKPDLDRPYFGHIFSDEDKKNLLETGNMGRVVELKGRGGEYIPSFVSIDKLTNEVVAMRAENVFIPKEIKGVKLTEQEQNCLLYTSPSPRDRG